MTEKKKVKKTIFNDTLEEKGYTPQHEYRLTEFLKRKFRLVLEEKFPELLASLDRAVFSFDLVPILREHFHSEKKYGTFCKENKIFLRDWWNQAEEEIQEQKKRYSQSPERN